MSILLLLLSVVIIILLTARYKVHPFLALLAAALSFALLSGMPLMTIVSSINDGFGITLGKIGLVIILGVIIGAFLENTGAAFKLAELILKVIGQKRIHAAMGIIGYIVSIPVFADSGFIILNPLNKSLSKKAGVSVAGTGVALMLGLLLTHVMIPPTPGPIAAAGILNADVGLVMLLGLLVSIPSLIIAIIYAKKIADKTYIDPNPDFTEEEIEEKTKNAPSAFKSVLPILIPILLIIGKSLINFYYPEENTLPTWAQLLNFIGSPVIALIIGLLLAFLLPKKWDQDILSTSGWVGKALIDAALILLVTGAGGIFGTILQNSGIADTMAGLLSGANLGIWLPFLLAAAIKTAQGSSTVALITTASIVAPLMGTLGFDTELQKALFVTAIGAGSIVVPHANDSSFWVFTQLTGMDIKTGYRIYTLGALVVGTFAGLMVFIASFFI
ncbi:MAG: GntP family permease [Saprospiraceae bacterium]